MSNYSTDRLWISTLVLGFRRTRSFVFVFLLLLFAFWTSFTTSIAHAESNGVLIIPVQGSINPATEDFIRGQVARAEQEQKQLIVLQLNTPGGLLSATQRIVELLLQSKVPIAVYVGPAGSSATSAGVFITLAGHFAVMAPGTTIGAAHPVSGGGQDLSDDMREKVENFAVSLIKAIAEQRGRNVQWAEQSVRESVSITDREAVDLKVVDFAATDIDSLLDGLEGRTVNVAGQQVVFRGLRSQPRQTASMTFRQLVVNVLADPNIAMLLWLGALLGIGIELYHPGVALPGIFGVICLVLALTSMQMIPIDYGGLALLLLGGIFIVVELYMPAFGIWGIAGIICLVLGAIYFVDMGDVWSSERIIDRTFFATVAGLIGSFFMYLAYSMLAMRRNPVVTGREGLIGQEAVVKVAFLPRADGYEGRVQVMGELWNARLDRKTGESEPTLPDVGSKVRIVKVAEAFMLIVES